MKTTFLLSLGQAWTGLFKSGDTTSFQARPPPGFSAASMSSAEVCVALPLKAGLLNGGGHASTAAAAKKESSIDQCMFPDVFFALRPDKSLL